MTPRGRLLSWSAFVLGGLGWAVSSQWGSMLVSDDCRAAQPWQITALGMAGLAIAAAGALLSRREIRDATGPTPAFIARVGLAACAVFALAICFHILAGLLIPRCAV